MKYISIARKYLNENYNFDDREITNYDFVMMGIAIGVALVAIKSFLLTADCWRTGGSVPPLI